ncbi:hypothetical protein FLL45_12595 [Aliikangiella marina]|uniref:Uncharacterized protein n=1 Tax=Aliikangiella marina TaxID=1712262 RepID=A0A545T907_9GAMM|nr:hypothetical protein [Aliikangiella marina]TQV73704.1 hypothetical protein FLL45_12595 [Aliikangiella marina]
MKSLKTILIAILTFALSVQASYLQSQGQPAPFIYELHPHTLYLVTLEYDKTENELDFYIPIPQTPEHSKNICRVKPQACYRPAAIEPPPGDFIVD